jgi:hypothetical protein
LPFPRHEVSEVLCEPPPSKRQGRRECRMLRRTRSLVCNKVSTRVSHYRYDRNIGIPCATVYDLWRALPGVRDLIVTVTNGSSSARLAPAQGAPGPHDFAVRFGRARRTRLKRPSHPAPNTRDDREAPLSRARDGRNVRLIWPFRQSRRPAPDWHDGQFAHDGHAQFSLGMSGKSVRRRGYRYRIYILDFHL